MAGGVKVTLLCVSDVPRGNQTPVSDQSCHGSPVSGVEQPQKHGELRSKLLIFAVIGYLLSS